MEMAIQFTISGEALGGFLRRFAHGW